MAIKDTKQYPRVCISVEARTRVFYSVACYCADRLLSAREGR
jgi:hypothetical protein